MKNIHKNYWLGRERQQQHVRYYIINTLIVSIVIIVSSIPQGYSDVLFNPPINASKITGSVFSPDIAVSGSNSYIVWTNNTGLNPGEISFVHSTNNGLSYSSAVDISHTINSSSNAKIAASGNNIVVAWQENNAQNQIYFSQSNDSGTSFGIPRNLTSPLISSTKPLVSSSGNNFYISWTEVLSGKRVIFFSKSTDGGFSFGPSKNLTNTSVSVFAGSTIMSMTTSGNNVYVVWSQPDLGNNEIFFTLSTNNGDSFSMPINISSTNPGDSVNPQIVVEGSNVYITWQDDKLVAFTHQIFAKTSTNNGTSFGSIKQISSTTGQSDGQLMAVQGSNVYIIWRGNPGTGFKETYFARSTDAGNSYLSTVNLSSDEGDSGSSTGISVSGTKVYTSWTDRSISSNRSVFFKASNDAGAHFGSFKSISNTPELDASQLVMAASGATTYLAWTGSDTISGNADIFTTSGLGDPTDDVTFNSTQYKITQSASIRAISVPLNGSSAINGTVTSTSDPTGIQVSLPETDVIKANFTGIIHFHEGSSNSGNNTLMVNSGDIITAQFGGEEGTALIFSRSIQFDFAFYTTDKKPTITITDQNANLNSTGIDVVNVKVNSTADPTGISFSISESGVNTGIFSQQIDVKNSASSVSTHTINATLNDTIFASYKNKITSAQVIPGVEPGGGGGGLIRPGLVLDLAASASYVPPSLRNLMKNLDPNKPIEPSADNTIDYPISIDGKGFPIASYSSRLATTSVPVGKPISFGLTYYTPRQISHVGIYFNLYGNSIEIPQSDTYVTYDAGQLLNIKDPHEIFSNVKMSSTKEDFKNKFVFTITFAKPMTKSDIITRAWDDTRVSTDSKILDALEVIQDTIPSENPIINQKQTVSHTIQSNPAYRESMLNSIKEWAGFSPKSISDSELLDKMGINENHIPVWVMKTTRWLVDNEITIDDFVNLVNYLHHSRAIH